MTASAYPLTWPPAFPRATRRETGAFKATLPQALKNVQDSLRLFASDSRTKLDGLVISSNVTLGENRPADPGVAIWFTWGDMQVCIPVDRYQTVQANLQAIHHIIEARRVELRHGSLALVRATFSGFKALPAPADERPWNVVLDLPADASVESIQEAWRRLAAKRHPDKPGGSHAAMTELNRAREQGVKARGG